MKSVVAWVMVSLVLLGESGGALAAGLKDQVHVAIDRVSLAPGMEPGTYVCALGHLHIRGTVENRAGVSLGRIKVAGKAFDSGGKLLGTATAWTRPASLAPGERAGIDLEFLTVTGPLIRQVKRYKVTVVAAPSKE